MQKNPTSNLAISKELMLRNKETGQWIKRSEDELALTENHIPTTLIQLIQNNIYYADTKLIFQKIIESRHSEVIDNLKKEYNTLIDILRNYQSYSTGIEKIFNTCENLVNDFDPEIKKISQKIISEEITDQSIEDLLNLAKAYVKVLFTYIYSATSIHKEKVKEETAILLKISNFKSHIQDLLEHTLIPTSLDKKYTRYNESLYPAFIYDKELNINYIKTLLIYDRRFDSIFDLIKETNHALQVNTNYNNSEFEIKGNFKKINPRNIKIIFIELLIKILGEIDRLEKIREEVIDISSGSILNSFELQVKNS